MKQHFSINWQPSDMESLRFAKIHTPFVLEIGTRLAAALEAANSLAAGRPIAEAAIAGARSAL